MVYNHHLWSRYASSVRQRRRYDQAKGTQVPAIPAATVSRGTSCECGQLDRLAETEPWLYPAELNEGALDTADVRMSSEALEDGEGLA